MRDRYEERTNTAIESVKTSMELASRELWKCDPKKHVEGVNKKKLISNCLFFKLRDIFR